MNSTTESIAMREFDEMNSYLFWGGNMNRDRFACEQDIWKYLNLDEICEDDSIKNMYKIHNKHEEFFKELPHKVNDWAAFRQYACKLLTIKGYERMLNNRNINKSTWIDIYEKYLKISSPDFYYNYYNRKNWETK